MGKQSQALQMPLLTTTDNSLSPCVRKFVVPGPSLLQGYRVQCSLLKGAVISRLGVCPISEESLEVHRMTRDTIHLSRTLCMFTATHVTILCPWGERYLHLNHSDASRRINYQNPSRQRIPRSLCNRHHTFLDRRARSPVSICSNSDGTHKARIQLRDRLRDCPCDCRPSLIHSLKPPRIVLESYSCTGQVYSSGAHGAEQTHEVYTDDERNTISTIARL